MLFSLVELPPDPTVKAWSVSAIRNGVSHQLCDGPTLFEVIQIVIDADKEIAVSPPGFEIGILEKEATGSDGSFLSDLSTGSHHRSLHSMNDRANDR
jgi:hypothetical protein